ncbi:TOMM precursor leader peptide-binding protein [Kitasatospora sp. CMC57]|uniref:TOMM leader peptide-binding protein n=1 Tax=Kitasatospora sp. CMC57 TaxID=3231513 RepID=A0AB33JXH1_9ACTN
MKPDVRRETPSPRGSLVGFKRHLRAEVVAGDGVYLISERGTTRLHGPHLEAVGPLLDGTRGIAALVRDARPGATASEIAELLCSLSEAGLVSYRARAPHESGSPARRAAEAYWDLAGLDGPHSAERAATARARVLTVGQVDGPVVRQALEDAGLPCLPPEAGIEDADLTVVVCDDYLAPGLRRIDARQRAAGRPWLLANPTGSITWTGPVFEPGTGACWSCLAHRLRAHRQPELALQQALRMREAPQGPAASLPVTRGLGLQLAALEAVKWLAGHRNPGQRAVHTLDTLTLEARTHTLVHRPQCPECGTPAAGSAAAGRPVVLRSRPKTSTRGNAHRSLTPQQVLDRYGHLVSPVTGAVKEITRSRYGPSFLNSFISGHNLATHSPGLPGTRQFSGGKGATELDARVSALCEALERCSGTYENNEPVVRDTLRGLGEAAVHPNRSQLYDERQYRDRDRWNAGHSGFHHVCDPLDDHTPIDWTPVWSLTGDRQRLLPTSLLYYDAPRPVPGKHFARADSNGCAAGSSLEDAVLQGFFELVERDAVALWWYNRTRQPGVDLAAFADPWIGELQEVHSELGREVWALDLTADFGVPVVAALSRRTDKPAEDIVFGFGAHFDPAVAVGRALAEMNQLLPGAVGAAADGTGYTLRDADALRWWRTATTASEPYLLPHDGLPATVPGTHPHVTRADLRDDVTAAGELVRRHGMELLVLDQTRPDIGLPVVRVVVPGMRSFWARFGPGRLYDVPVALGRLAEPTAYQDLNPVLMFV